MRLHFALIASALALAALPASATNLIVNGDFETGDFTGWTVTAGATSVQVSGGNGGYAPESGSYYAALGNVGGLGTLSETFSDTAGQGYELSYFLASNGTAPNEFEAVVDSTTFIDQVDLGVTPYTEYNFFFTGTGSDTLTFYERNDPDYLALDNVSVGSTSATTPEPSSLILVGTGLAGFAGAVRRRLARA